VIAGNHFGASVDYDGSLAVIGAPGTDADRGAAHVFARFGSSWAFATTLTPEVRDIQDGFGDAVSIEETLAAVGAPADDASGQDAGAVFVFSLSPIVSVEPDLPRPTISLDHNWPEPARDATTIRYTVPDGSQVDLSLYDVMGRRIAVLDSGFRSGEKEIAVDAANLPPGVYVYRLSTGRLVGVRMMTVAR
jgi:hypothetical protein